MSGQVAAATGIRMGRRPMRLLCLLGTSAGACVVTQASASGP